MMQTHVDIKTAQLSSLLNQVLEANDAERCDLSHRLQEDLGQTLAALAVHLRVAERSGNDSCKIHLTEARSLISDALGEVERMVLELYPPALEGQGFGPALEVYVQAFVQRTGIVVELDLEVITPRLPQDVELGLFRITQEALETACHHRLVTHVQIVLRQVDNQIVLLITDNGIGYSATVLSDWSFLRMTQRAEALGAKCAISVNAGRGARIDVTLNLEPEMLNHD